MKEYSSIGTLDLFATVSHPRHIGQVICKMPDIPLLLKKYYDSVMKTDHRISLKIFRSVSCNFSSHSSEREATAADRSLKEQPLPVSSTNVKWVSIGHMFPVCSFRKYCQEGSISLTKTIPTYVHFNQTSSECR